MTLPEVPFCRDCAQLVGVRGNTASAASWACAASPFTVDPVTGARQYIKTCYAAREEGQPCGPLGTLFQPYTPSAYVSRAAPAGKHSSADTLLGELGL